MNAKGRKASWRAGGVAWAFVGTLSLAASANAQQIAHDPETAPAPAAVEGESLGRATALFHDAEARYAGGDLEGARASMQSAYELSGRAELLFNLGELERELGHCPQALEDYAAYLARVKNGSHREQAEQRSAELGAECPDHQAAPVPAPLAPASAPAPVVVPAPPRPDVLPARSSRDYWTPINIAGWSTLGASVIAGATATYFAIDAARAESSLEQRIQLEQATGGGFSAADKALEQEGQRSENLALGFAAGAAGLAVVGVTLLALPQGRAKDSPNGVAVTAVGVSGPTAVCRGTF